MQTDDMEVPPALAAAHLLSSMGSMFLLGLGAQLANFCAAQQTALTDPFSALTDRSQGIKHNRRKG